MDALTKYNDEVKDKYRARIAELEAELKESVSENVALRAEIDEWQEGARAGMKIDREALASTQHNIWTHWMAYLFACCEPTDNMEMIIPRDKVERWSRQMNTLYYELSESEKKSDRDQADKIIALIGGR